MMLWLAAAVSTSACATCCAAHSASLGSSPAATSKHINALRRCQLAGLAPHTVMHATPPFLSLDVFEVLEVVVHVHHVLLRALVTPVLLATCRTSLATRRTSLGAIRRQSRLPLALASGFRER